MPTAEKSAYQFVRVSNDMLRSVCPAAAVDSGRSRFTSLRELGLYMMLSGILSNPSFRSAPGGLQNLLLSHCRNRYFSLHGAWKKLSADGWLHRIRIPCGLNRFLDCYDLQKLPTPGSSSGVHLTSAEGNEYLAAHGPFVPPTEDFTKVSYPMLMDARLSLAAKGLYAMIARLLRLSEQQPRLRITKDLLRSMCGEGKNAFDGLFRELRNCGYLFLERTWDAVQERIGFRYILSPTTDNMTAADDSACSGENDTETKTASVCMENTDTVADLYEKKEKRSSLFAMHTVNADAAVTEKSRGGVPKTPVSAPGPLPPERDTQRAVEEQIEYPVLKADYPKERLDFIVSILSDSIRGAQRSPDRLISLGADQLRAEEIAEHYKALDCEDVRYVLDTYLEQSHKTKIHNVRKYLMTCLYHAKENFSMALDAFGSRICGDVLPV